MTERVITATTVAFARPTFDTTMAASCAAAARSLLEQSGVSTTGDGELVTTTEELNAMLDRLDRSEAEVDVVVVMQATFTDASMMLRLAERASAPVVCWSFPEPRSGENLRLNSLCGANLAAHSLRRRGDRTVFVHVDPAADDAADRIRAALELARSGGAPLGHNRRRDGTATAPISIEAAASAARVAATLRGAAIGVIGEHPDGFEPCDYDPGAVASLTGARCEKIELHELFRAADAVPDTTVQTIAARAERSVEIDERSWSHGLEPSLRLYGGLRSLASSHGWNVVATRCWPECMTEYGGAVCAPQAMLTEDGIPAMCEADVYGGLTALVLRELAGTDPFLADLVDADRGDDTSVMWHCGLASPSLADPKSKRRGTVHPNRDRALIFDFALRPGRVTVARLSQLRDGPAMVVGSGEMLPRDHPFAGTCGVMRWDSPIDGVLDTIFTRGIEHHYVIAYGDQRDALVALAGLWRIPVVHLT